MILFLLPVFGAGIYFLAELGRWIISRPSVPPSPDTHLSSASTQDRRKSTRLYQGNSLSGNLINPYYDDVHRNRFSIDLEHRFSLDNPDDHPR